MLDAGAPDLAATARHSVSEAPLSGTRLELDLVSVFSELSAIPLEVTETAEALQRITELGRRVMGSAAFTLTRVDLDNRYLEQQACSDTDPGFRARMTGKRIRLGSKESGAFLWYDLFVRGEVRTAYGLATEGQGIANPHTAARYNLHSMLSYPLKAGDQLLGYLNHFSSEDRQFTPDEFKLLEIFARQAVTTIEKATFIDSLMRRTQALAEADSSGAILNVIAETAREWLREPACMIWLLDKGRGGFVLSAQRAPENVSTEDLFLQHDCDWVSTVLRSDTPVLFSAWGRHPVPPVLARVLKTRWIVAMRLADRQHVIGFIVVSSPNPDRLLTNRDRALLTTLALQASVDLQNYLQRARLVELIHLLQEMHDVQEENPLIRLVLERGLKMLGCRHGVVRTFNLKTGELEHRFSEPKAKRPFPIGFGEGITGMAIQRRAPVRIRDLRQEPAYIPLWEPNRSKLVVPILLPQAQVRVGRSIETAQKILGVLNFESPACDAFSEFDEECAFWLGRHMARIMERIEFDRKLKGLQKVERSIMGEQDWESIIEHVLEGIKNTLGYEYVNISLVNFDENTIRTAYLSGLPKEDIDDFRRMAVHDLDSNDIQADVVRSKFPEVPLAGDERFDKMYDRFHHSRLIRVYMPMIRPSDKLAIGTVEAGYAREHREHIYERDVQILKGFVDYATMALEQRRRGQIDRISHELNAPLAAIRANASVLQRRWKQLSEERIQRQLNDMLTDSEVLLFQVKQLEHIMGSRGAGAEGPLRSEPVLLFRDIVFKTISQLRPLVVERGLDPSRIQHEQEDVHKVKPIYSDKSKLSQVFFNLFMNSLKYFETPETFEIRIGAEETREHYVIRFLDWGIGIPPGLEEKVFEDGYRAPTARKKDVSGSGFGLTIARKIMRELGGDLRLVNNHYPTEFQILIRKTTKGAA